mmetsp:Transcript_12105/g.30655  ORF Transcript_12105/g.30655 Transcript_12105/m.30655 type:complete len:304 (+) Transcript_12105:59-970(+)|eukprot:CAMPEP_0177652056 /NCGR_PEP_ID=MMETSP0447-20121125/12900_1 /TAXON_ID=0 /ORGANISM="Stygamoeba regulata, Strain BSH-02190019" /LENGTH=303 /DNA_ID=CAMNT_0019155223 /DNA_START=59 /DNA_END=970 /DNA_ORIENTATION=-
MSEQDGVSDGDLKVAIEAIYEPFPVGMPKLQYLDFDELPDEPGHFILYSTYVDGVENTSAKHTKEHTPCNQVLTLCYKDAHLFTGILRPDQRHAHVPANWRPHAPPPQRLWSLIEPDTLSSEVDAQHEHSHHHHHHHHHHHAHSQQREYEQAAERGRLLGVKGHNLRKLYSSCTAILPSHAKKASTVKVRRKEVDDGIDADYRLAPVAFEAKKRYTVAELYGAQPIVRLEALKKKTHHCEEEIVWRFRLAFRTQARDLYLPRHLVDRPVVQPPAAAAAAPTATATAPVASSTTTEAAAEKSTT